MAREERLLGSGTQTILVVEDEPVQRSNLSLAIQDWGYHALEAANGPEALARVREKVAAWWQQTPDKSCQATVQTYYGPQKLHEVLERSTWHIAQHDRQWMMLLDMAGIAFERPLADTDFADLPMPKKVWDD